MIIYFALRLHVMEKLKHGKVLNSMTLFMFGIMQKILIHIGIQSEYPKLIPMIQIQNNGFIEEETSLR